jgi:ubiquinone/menaquinone biosynthesis C-methylase UbiE
MKKEILLPGLDDQLKLLKKITDIEGYVSIVFGSESILPAETIYGHTGKRVEVIVEDYDSLINSRFQMGDKEKVNIRLMDFERTDFNDHSADLVYAQASVSDVRRNKIIKEIKRILKPGGIFCVGEIIKLTDEVPAFVKDIFDNSELNPFSAENMETFYTDRNFEIIERKDLSGTLKKYYSIAADKLKEALPGMSDSEKSYYKKVLNKISHESNAYIKNGADKFIGFNALLMRRN